MGASGSGTFGAEDFGAMSSANFSGGGGMSAGSGVENAQGFGPAGFGSRPRTANSVPRAVENSRSLPAFGEAWPKAGTAFDQYREPVNVGSGSGGSSIVGSSVAEGTLRPNTSQGLRT